MSQTAAAKIFGVSQNTFSRWEIGVEPDEKGQVKGKRIPDQVLPLLQRWLESEQVPDPEELTALTTRRRGRA